MHDDDNLAFCGRNNSCACFNGYTAQLVIVNTGDEEPFQIDASPLKASCFLNIIKQNELSAATSLLVRHAILDKQRYLLFHAVVRHSVFQ